MHSYFRLLSRLAALEENDASLMQLAHSVAPAIARPLNTAYMSLKHMEDLKKVRPVILFMVENFVDIFSFTKSFRGHLLPAPLPGEHTTDAMPSPGQGSGRPAAGFGLSLGIGSLSLSGNGLHTSSDEDSSNPSFPFVKPSLLVSIPSSNNDAPPAIPDSELMETSEGGKAAGHLSKGEVYSDQEWKVFHGLICLKVSNFLSLSESETNQFLSIELSGDSYYNAMQAWTAKQALVASGSLNIGSPCKPDLSTVPPSPKNTSSITSLTPGSSSSSTAVSSLISYAKSLTRRNKRRKLVSECKALRAKIYEFEQDFSKKFNRMPKAQERGMMQNTYVKYRELKKDIRETAANDMIRVARGFITRRRKVSGRFKSSLSKSDDNLKTTAMEESNASNNRNSSSTADSTNDEYDYNIKRFRELLETKRDLKKKLKKFDEDFQEQNGRAPKKSDKEVIRPMYQKYHEIKNTLDALRVVLQGYNGTLPDDILADIMSPQHTGTMDKKVSSSTAADSDMDDNDGLTPYSSRNNVSKWEGPACKQ